MNGEIRVDRESPGASSRPALLLATGGGGDGGRACLVKEFGPFAAGGRQQSSKLRYMRGRPRSHEQDGTGERHGGEGTTHGVRGSPAGPAPALPFIFHLSAGMRL